VICPTSFVIADLGYQHWKTELEKFDARQPDVEIPKNKDLYCSASRRVKIFGLHDSWCLLLPPNDYAFAPVCLFVNRITLKVIDEFSRISERYKKHVVCYTTGNYGHYKLKAVSQSE